MKAVLEIHITQRKWGLSATEPLFHYCNAAKFNRRTLCAFAVQKKSWIFFHCVNRSKNTKQIDLALPCTSLNYSKTHNETFFSSNVRDVAKERWKFEGIFTRLLANTEHASKLRARTQTHTNIGRDTYVDVSVCTAVSKENYRSKCNWRNESERLYFCCRFYFSTEKSNICWLWNGTFV